MVMCFASCGNAQKETKEKIDVLIVGTTAEILTANRAEYNFDVISGTLSQGALVKLNENGSIEPFMAEYKTEDYKTWTFTLKEGLTWHDGEKVTAEDIKFTFEYLEQQNGGGYAADYEAINVLDERNVEFVLKAANVRALSGITTTRLIPKHIYEGVEKMADVENEKANIGCGPYKYVRFDEDAGVVEFEAYEGYVDGTPNVKKVMLKTFGNADTMYLALKNSEIDMIYVYASGIDTTVIKDLSKAENVELKPVKDLSNTAVLVFNNDKEPWNNVLLRKAVKNAIDYDKFKELFGTEFSTPAKEGFVPEGTFGFVETNVNKQDIDAAKKLLEQAGAVDENNDGILELNGKPLTLELYLRSDKSVYQRYGELLKANLEEVGIAVDLKTTEVAQFREITEKTHTNQAMVSKFTAYGMSMGAGMGTSYMDKRLSANGQGQIADERFAKIVDSLKSAESEEDYLNAAKQCQEFYANEVPAIALYWDSYVQAYSNKLSGFVTDGTFGILNFETWFSIEKAK